MGIRCYRKVSSINHDVTAVCISSMIFLQPATLGQKTISNKVVKHPHRSVTTKIYSGI